MKRPVATSVATGLARLFIRLAHPPAGRGARGEEARRVHEVRLRLRRHAGRPALGLDGGRRDDEAEHAVIRHNSS